jgi:succinate dehydrogenase / fumarate reductase membrane anchor subunit
MTLMSLKRPFGGMTQWIYQRFTAMFMLIYLLLIFVLISIKGDGYQGWFEVMSPVWMKILTTLFFYLMVIHAFIGVQHVTDDYIPYPGLRKLMNTLFLGLVVIQVIGLPYVLFGGVN